MSIKGFNVNGVTERYDYNSLDNIPDIQGLPTGGTEGQVLAKTSGADYAVGWVNQTGGGGGGSETDEIFWATRNVTTFAEVQEAVADGKLCAVKTGGSLSSDTYYLFYISDTRATFGNFSIINSRISALSLYSSNSWTYESLTIPEVLTFDTTPKQYSNNPVRSYGIWNAIQAAKTTVDATLSATSENPVQNRSVYEALATKADLSSVEPFVQDAVDEWMETYAPTIGTLSNAAKRALLNCFAHVAWIDDQGQTYYNALESELFPDATLESITAVFTQGSAVIYENDSLDTLKQYLTVTATFSDSTTATVTDYTLSGTLIEGTSTITVSYGGKTDTFDVVVSGVNPYLYVLSSPFTSTGVDVIDTNIAFEANKTYTFLCDHTKNGTPSGVSYIYGNKSTTNTYLALQLQNAIMWGVGISYSNGKNLGPANKRIRTVAVVAFDANGACSVSMHYKNITDSGTVRTFSNTYTNILSNTKTVCLGDSEGTGSGAPVTVHDFKIYNGSMPSADIDDYLTTGA